jgi:hypothetical protein
MTRLRRKHACDEEVASTRKKGNLNGTAQLIPADLAALAQNAHSAHACQSDSRPSPLLLCCALPLWYFEFVACVLQVYMRVARWNLPSQAFRHSFNYDATLRVINYNHE